MSPEQKVEQLASRQHSVITHTQAVALGMTPPAVRARQVSGRWQRMYRGVYRLAGSPATVQQRVMAACLAAGEGALASHVSAAHLLGLEHVGTPPEPQITVPAQATPKIAGVRIYRSRDLRETDRCLVDRVPTTRPARLLLDLAGTMDPVMFERILDDALAARRLTLGQLQSRMDLCTRGRPGLRLLRRLVAERVGEGRPLNSFERDILRLLAAHGFVPTATQYELVMPSGRRLFLDAAWPEHRFGIEGQSFRWHSAKSAWRHDQGRLAELHAINWHVLPICPEDLEERPLWIIAQVALGLSAEGVV